MLASYGVTAVTGRVGRAAARYEQGKLSAGPKKRLTVSYFSAGLFNWVVAAITASTEARKATDSRSSSDLPSGGCGLEGSGV